MAKEIKISEAVRTGVKLATSGSVQMMLGGVVAALMPPTVSIPYKIATWIGSMVLGMYAGDKLDEYVDQKLDETESALTEVSEVIETAKEKSMEHTEMGA